MSGIALRLPLAGAAALACLAVGCSPGANETATETAAENAQTAADAATTAADTAVAAANNAVDPDAAAALVVEPEAIAALEQMSAYLRTLEAFEMQANTSADTVLESGQLATFEGKVIYRVRKPDAFKVEWDTDRKERTLYYDGKMITLYAPRMGYYAQAEAPATVSEAIVQVESDYGLDLPIADLFRWGTDASDVSAITSGVVVGPARVNDVEAAQYAFRQGDVDWQIFIQAGDKPLPRKIVITTRSDPARPQFTATLDWKESPSLAPATFVFTPGKDDKRIAIEKEQS